MIDDNGWLLPEDHIPIALVPSPNFNQRPADEPISLLVVHNISLPPNEFGGGYIEQFFTNCLPVDDHPYFKEIDGVEVSAHVLIDRKGQITQFVSFDDRAWHAGKSEHQGRCDCNDFSIGVELEGCDTEPYSEVQYWRLEWLIRGLFEYYPELNPETIVGHEHISPGRKSDPGPYFNWARLQKSLLA
ncbi:1,6-anhydro-N-acetylmuramyl-L-alanine amidase AmpD [Halioxenophilus aromaticivorans]|uniref:1,6-anhydro-N-acetylmuramyl-L-alanine amidase AmpD n=1 Tax=Halioxenophilus aromaticivorans TaxID=1306992 RepID=A0AAV3TYN3_9ALTE